ncbi:MAG TPA: zinc ABC transporter substrate-binding protein [Candidatus Limnocylindria bacterium]|nr:zinc ABC transporter substrate-binding protein [Candidatus Limnocylindria bacterium]
MKRARSWLAWAALISVLAGCGGDQGGTGGAAKGGSGPTRVTCTIGMIADAARIIGGPHVQVTGLMGPGVDPHLYKASEGDIQKLTGAAVILYLGLNLEGKMGDLMVKMSRTRPTFAVSEFVPESLLREPPEFLGHYDPHIWFDVSLWRRSVERVRDALSELDPSHRADFERAAAAYDDSLEALHAWVGAEMATVPKGRRVLVTAHDAFGYFGRAYDVDVVGLQGISTVTEYGLADVRRLVDLITSRGVKAVFIESSVPRRSIDAVVEGCRARGHAVTVGGTLYSDAMGADGTPEGTYVGMVRANVSTIVGALR